MLSQWLLAVKIVRNVAQWHKADNSLPSPDMRSDCIYHPGHRVALSIAYPQCPWMRLSMFFVVTAIIALVIALFASFAKGPPFRWREFAWLTAGAWILVIVIGGVLYLGWLVNTVHDFIGRAIGA
jgi:hypothetical protein